MKIGLSDLVIFSLLQGFNTLQFLTSHHVTSETRTRVCMEMYGDLWDYRLTKKLIGAPCICSSNIRI